MVLNKSLKIFKKNHSRNIYFMINVGNILLLIYSAVCDYKKLRQTKYKITVARSSRPAVVKLLVHTKLSLNYYS